MLSYSSQLASACRTILQKYELSSVKDEIAEQHSKKLEKLRCSGPFYFYLQRVANSQVYSESGDPVGSRDWILHPFYSYPKTPSRILAWIGFRMRFDSAPTGGLFLDHLAVQLARGQQTILPLLRAEWDCRGPHAGQFLHSQPHWHIYPARLSSAPEPDPVDAKWATVQEHLHLSMCARWHNIKGPALHHATLGTVQELKEWLQSLLAYLREQVEYALERVNLEPAEPLEEIRGD
jgi:hypothetical protein